MPLSPTHTFHVTMKNGLSLLHGIAYSSCWALRHLKKVYRLNPRVCKIRQPLDTKVFEKADIFWCFHGVEIAKITNQACKIRYLGVIELSTFIFISIISLKCKLIHKATEFDLHSRENLLHKASFHEDRNVQQIVENPCFTHASTRSPIIINYVMIEVFIYNHSNNFIQEMSSLLYLLTIYKV